MTEQSSRVRRLAVLTGYTGEMRRPDNEDIIEFEYSGTPIADRGDTAELQAMMCGEVTVFGQRGRVVSYEKIAGDTPWDGVGERPRYRVRFRLA